MSIYTVRAYRNSASAPLQMHEIQRQKVAAKSSEAETFNAKLHAGGYDRQHSPQDSTLLC